MASSERKYPLRKPANHIPPIPRYQLLLDDHLAVHTAYIGLQQHSQEDSAQTARSRAREAIREWLGDKGAAGPLTSEFFTLLDGNDGNNVEVWVCYWLDEEQFESSLDRLALKSLHSSLPNPGRDEVGLWLECFSTPTSRLETNYSGLDYLPGLARLPETSTEEHSLSAYWGVARDRIPDSAQDLFEKVHTQRPMSTPQGTGQHLFGTNPRNIVHIHSGQFWENCGREESASYEEKLEPTLRNGLQYLWDNPIDSGAMGVRYLLNQDSASSQVDYSKRESCVAGFFTDLKSLEDWAKTHRSHLAIYRGALAHAKAFGADRKFRTWHEVSVLEEGDARFEYINCLPDTGVMQFVTLAQKPL